MKLNVLQENLLKALSRAGRVIPLKPQLPIIQNVLLETEEGRLKIVGTNLETTEVIFVGAKIEEEGGACMSSRLLLDFVSSLPQGTIQIASKEGGVLISCGGFRATIPAIDAKEFPRVQKVAPVKPMKVEKEELTRAIERVIFSAATDEARPLLTGVRINQKEGETVFTATDGYRLSTKRITLSVDGELNLLVPAKALSEVVKVCAEEKSVKTIQIFTPSDGQATFVVGDTEIQTRLIDGEYPNIEKTIPTKRNTQTIIDKELLVGAVKSAAIFARDSANIIRFHIDGNVLTVSANTPQVGEDEIDVEVKTDGEGGDIAFNSRFLIEFLSNFPEEEIVFEMTGSLNPGVFKSAKDEGYLHIIMPVRVQG